MAKLKSDQIQSADLLEYLNSHSDFSFELSVLKMLREMGLDCEHGGHYEDPVTNKSREFDIRAKKTLKQWRVRAAIECKNIRDNFPILVSCVPRHDQEAYHQVVLVSDPHRDSASIAFSIPGSRATTLSVEGEHSIYRAHEPVGKSTVQVGRATDSTISANDSELYEKWGQCLGSVSNLIRDVYWDGGSKDSEALIFSAVFPFVVVPNGRLWMVSYDENGTRICDPTPTNRCSCFISKDYEMGTKIAGTKISLSHVEIVTFDGLRTFVEQYLLSEEGMSKVFSKAGIKAAYMLSVSRKA